jgi:hypothetical protein
MMVLYGIMMRANIAGKMIMGGDEDAYRHDP